jgi:hypothetical protein
LSLSKGEQLIVIDNPNDVQWPKVREYIWEWIVIVQARNALGMTGVVPTNYIQLATASPLPTIRFAPNDNAAGISSISRDNSNSQAPASSKSDGRWRCWLTWLQCNVLVEFSGIVELWSTSTHRLITSCSLNLTILLLSPTIDQSKRQLFEYSGISKYIYAHIWEYGRWSLT